MSEHFSENFTEHQAVSNSFPLDLGRDKERNFPTRKHHEIEMIVNLLLTLLRCSIPSSIIGVRRSNSVMAADTCQQLFSDERIFKALLALMPIKCAAEREWTRTAVYRPSHLSVQRRLRRSPLRPTLKSKFASELKVNRERAEMCATY